MSCVSADFGCFACAVVPDQARNDLTCEMYHGSCHSVRTESEDGVSSKAPAPISLSSKEPVHPDAKTRRAGNTGFAEISVEPVLRHALSLRHRCVDREDERWLATCDDVDFVKRSASMQSQRKCLTLDQAPVWREDLGESPCFSEKTPSASSTAKGDSEKRGVYEASPERGKSPSLGQASSSSSPPQPKSRFIASATWLLERSFRRSPSADRGHKSPQSKSPAEDSNAASTAWSTEEFPRVFTPEKIEAENKEQKWAGSRYVGEWSDGKPEGYGILRSPNGDYYEGRWSNGEKHGEGELLSSHAAITPKLSSIVGTSARQQDEQVAYRGQWSSGLKEGHGIQEWENGTLHEGTYENDSMKGSGKLILASGAKYEGEFSDDCFHGGGCMRYADGSSYTGQWHEGQREGCGTYEMPDGSTYIGRFQDDVPHGTGSILRPDGQRYTGQWIQGKQHGNGKVLQPDGALWYGLWTNGHITQWLGKQSLLSL